MQIILLLALFIFFVLYNFVLSSLVFRGYQARWLDVTCMFIDLLLITAVLLIDTGIHSFAW